jgi:2,4-dienoyl-CoA reductase-like NADH-dependent reductase (Old Yellow Enzyme family)
MSEQDRFIDRDLIARIEKFIARGGLSATSFGMKSVNDPRLVADLKDGRELRRKTRERIEAFIRGDA